MAGYWNLTNISQQPCQQPFLSVEEAQDYYVQRYAPSTNDMRTIRDASELISNEEQYVNEALPYFERLNIQRTQRKPISRIYAPVNILRNIRPQRTFPTQFPQTQPHVYIRGPPQPKVPPQPRVPSQCQHYRPPIPLYHQRRECNQFIPHNIQPQPQIPLYQQQRGSLQYKPLNPPRGFPRRVPQYHQEQHQRKFSVEIPSQQTLSRGPLEAPWPHIRSYRKPCANPARQSISVPQIISADDEAEERRLLTANQNYSNQPTKVRPQPLYEEQITREFTDTNLYNGQLFTETFYTDVDDIVSNIPKRFLASSRASRTSSSSGSKSNYVQSQKDKKTISLFEIGKTDTSVGSRDPIMNIYWKIYKTHNFPDIFPECDSDFSLLSKTIWLKHKNRLPSIDDYNTKMNIWKQLQTLMSLRRMFSDRKLFITGSTLAGLSLNDSDLDLCLVGEKRPGLPDRYNCIFHLESFKHILQTIKEISDVNIILAKFPLLRFTVKSSYSVTVDVNCNNIVSVANTQLLYSYTKCDWRFQPLYSIIKQWAIYHHINDASRQTLSSYSITLLVIQFLQCGISPPVLPSLHEEMKDNIRWKDICTNSQLEVFSHYLMEWQSTNEMSLGELLINFFEFYEKFDFTKYVVSTRLGKPILKDKYITEVSKETIKAYAFINIEEPFMLTNTAYSVHCLQTYEYIVDTFAKSASILRSSMSLESIFK